MSASAYVLAAFRLVLLVGGALGVGVAVRRGLRPTARGAWSALTVAVGSYGFLVVLGELLGTVHLFSRWPLAIGAAAAGLVALAVTRGAPDRPAPAPRGPLTPLHVIAGLFVALLGAEALVELGSASREGITATDSVVYHLPDAAHFVTTHATTTLLQANPGNGQAFYHLNDELIHGIFMAVLGRDSISVLLGPIAVALCVLAAYCFGTVFEAGPLAICAVTPVIGYLGAFFSQGLNDWSALWPFLAAAALFVAAPRDGDAPRRIAIDVPTALLVGLAVGLAIGTKLNLLAPAALLGVVAAAVAVRRGVALLAITAGAVVTGSYWLLRNLVVVGSPIPTLHLPGLPHTSASLIDRYGFSVAHYLTKPHIVRHWYITGLHDVFGVLWPVLLLLAVAGVVLAAWRGDRPTLPLLAGLVAVGTAAYLVTPTTAFGPPDRPFLFPENIRYAWPVLALALLLLVVSPLGRRFALPLAILFGAVFVGELDNGIAFPGSTATHRVLAVVAASLVTLGGYLVLRSRLSGKPSAALVAVVAVAALAIGYPLQQHYLRHRYRDTATPSERLFAWGQRLHHQRIGVLGVGYYPLLGPSFDNLAIYLGQMRPHHGFENFSTCVAFRRAVVGAQLTVVVIAHSPVRPTPEFSWMSAGGSTVVYADRQQ
ncbi:MAG: hypothetical protein JO222_11615, partial [Frankiales bacterium]|nr:hypothetical protein [Frankiales bacterium]